MPVAANTAIQLAGREGKVLLYSFYVDKNDRPLIVGASPSLKAVVDGNVAVLSDILIAQMLSHVATGTPYKSVRGFTPQQVVVDAQVARTQPLNQNGPVAPVQIQAPYFHKWDHQYTYTH
jgi:hypothetical protein